MTEPTKDVAVSGGRGVVVGDYATVFQRFDDTSPAIASYIRSAQFRTLVDERTREFVGREFVFEAVDRLMAGTQYSSGYIVIKGEPGIGKTSVAAALVLRGGYPHHFNVAPENIRSPRQFLENVCAQLIVCYGLDHVAMPPNAGNDAGFLKQLLAEAVAQARQQRNTPVVIVIDALDEAEDAGLPADANRLFLPRTLPEGVFFIVTSREEADYRLDVDNTSEIWIRDDDPANTEDVARYIARFIETYQGTMTARLDDWSVSREEFVAQISTLSEGNFMYLIYVLPEISLGGLSKATVGGVQELPRGLKGYYMRHWREMKDRDVERFQAFQRPVLCFLAIGREPVSVEQLVEWTGLEPSAVRSVIRSWREFLNEDVNGRPTRYRIYHRSFAEFLDEQEDLRWYHNQIATHALSKIPGFLNAASPG